MSRIKHGTLHVGDVGQMATIIFISKPFVSARSQSTCCLSVLVSTLTRCSWAADQLGGWGVGAGMS